jgi:hypothetical protein
MSKHPSRHDFGKRRPAPLELPDMPPPKRSSHVALLVMGTLAVGGGAYALVPHRSCQPPAPPAPGMAAPALPQTGTACTTSTSGGGGSSGYSRSHFSFFGGGSSSGGSSAHGPESSSSGVVRGGFGSFAHALGFGSSS